MTFGQIAWLPDFLFVFVCLTAGNALFKLHAAHQPITGLLIESLMVSVGISLVNYFRKRGADELWPRPKKQ